jgi:hypothetical protein
MRRYSLFIIALLAFCQSNGQLLQGRWEGNFIENGNKYPIRIDFILNPDSTYSVYSYSEGDVIFDFKRKGSINLIRDSQIVCKVFYKFSPPDSVYLEEFEVIQPQNLSQNRLQTMYLQIKKHNNKIELAGKWETDSGTSTSSGKITLSKKPGRKTNLAR